MGAVLDAPSHPYTRALLACHPDRATSFIGIPGMVPSPLVAAGRLPVRAALPRCAAGLPRSAAAAGPCPVRRRSALRANTHDVAQPIRDVSVLLGGRKRLPAPDRAAGACRDRCQPRPQGRRDPRRWSANPAAARPRSAAPSSASSAKARARSASTARVSAACRRGGAPGAQGIQYVHQDAGAALDPWWSIGRTLAEGLLIHGVRNAGERRDRVARCCRPSVSIRLGSRYAHEFSGGQLRRVALARILLLSRASLVLDEPTSGLDMSVQATVLNLLLELRERFSLTYLFISHDLSVVERLSDRVAIMYLGRIVETAPARELFAHPTHPYTRILLAAAPRLNGRRATDHIAVRGDPPSAAAIHAGCAFADRCPLVEPICRSTVPRTPRTPRWRIALPVT